MRKLPFVERITWSRRPLMAWPRISSASPFEYTSAESNILRPASRQMPTSRDAPAAPVDPHALKNSVPPPNVPVPRLSTGTLNPELPRVLYSIATVVSSPHCIVYRSKRGAGTFRLRQGYGGPPERNARRLVGPAKSKGEGIVKAVRVHEFGGPEVLRLDDIDLPRPGAGQVLVKIAFSGVNYLDIQYRTGRAHATQFP